MQALRKVRPRRRSPKGELRRQQILEAASRIFARDGFGTASIAEVAAEVGLTLPGLLHYFPSKTEMLLAVLEMRDLRHIHTSSPATQREPLSLQQHAQNPMPWTQLLQLLRSVTRGNADSAGVVKLFALLNAESLIEAHPAQDWFSRRADLLLTLFSGSLRQAQQRGEIDTQCNPEQVAAELVAMMDGLQMLWLRRPQQLDLVACFEAYLDRLQSALSPE